MVHAALKYYVFGAYILPFRFVGGVFPSINFPIPVISKMGTFGIPRLLAILRYFYVPFFRIDPCVVVVSVLLPP